MHSMWKVGRAACVPVAVIAAMLVPAATGVAAGPPAPVGSAGHTVQLVARGIPSPTQIAVVHGNVFVSAAGDEKTGKGGGLWAISHGKASQMDSTPYYGLVFTHGRLFASGNNQIVSGSVDGRCAGGSEGDLPAAAHEAPVHRDDGGRARRAPLHGIGRRGRHGRDRCRPERKGVRDQP